jgi:hypothetical protein
LSPLDRWEHGSVAERRALIVQLADVRVRPVRNGRGGWPVPPPVHRIEWRWRCGDSFVGVTPVDALPALDRRYYAALDAPVRREREQARADYLRDFADSGRKVKRTSVTGPDGRAMIETCG